MHRLLPLLWVVVVVGGCTSQPDATLTMTPRSASTPVVSEDQAGTSPPATTQPTQATPTTQPAPSSPPTISTPKPTPTPVPPTARPDYADSRSGWVTPPQSDPTLFIAKLTFLVYAGANITARSTVTTLTASGIPSVATPKVVNLTLLDPEGKVAYWQSRQHTVDATNETLQSNATIKPGEWTLVYTIQGGASDGATTGDRYAISILVRY